MVNILDIDPECFMVGNVKECTDGTMLYNIYFLTKQVYNTLFLII